MSNSSLKSQLTVVEGFHAAAIFVDGIWWENKDKDVFSSADLEVIAHFCTHFSFDPASIEDWRRCYFEMGGCKIPADEIPSSSVDNNFISSIEALRVLQIMAEWHYRDFGFEFPQFILLLTCMLDDPLKNTPYWDLWNQAVQSAKKGEKLGYE